MLLVLPPAFVQSGCRYTSFQASSSYHLNTKQYHNHPPKSREKLKPFFIVFIKYFNKGYKTVLFSEVKTISFTFSPRFCDHQVLVAAMLCGFKSHLLHHLTITTVIQRKSLDFKGFLLYRKKSKRAIWLKIAILPLFCKLRENQ